MVLVAASQGLMTARCSCSQTTFTAVVHLAVTAQGSSSLVLMEKLRGCMLLVRTVGRGLGMTLQRLGDGIGWLVRQWADATINLIASSAWITSSAVYS